MPPEDRVLFVSLKPRYAEMLLSGVKTVELRRRPPSVRSGALVLLYASSPDCRLVGTACVAGLDTTSPSDIWRSHGGDTGLDRATYDAYFDGAASATAISLQRIAPLARVRPLSEIRSLLDGFRPPQSFRYLTMGEATALI